MYNAIAPQVIRESVAVSLHKPSFLIEIKAHNDISVSMKQTCADIRVLFWHRKKDCWTIEQASHTHHISVAYSAIYSQGVGCNTITAKSNRKNTI